MKAGTFILSFLFVVLTIQPAFTKWADVSCTKETASTKIIPQSPGCCKKAVAKTCPSKKGKEQAPQKQQAGDPCNTCNPFMACNACPYINVDKQELLPPFTLMTGGNASQVTGDLSSYDTDFWHPPELFMHL